MGSQSHAWTWESVPQNTFTPQEPLLELLQLGLRTNVTSVMTPPSDKAFLIQMLLKESANELQVKLKPRSCCCPHWAWLLVAQEAGLWAGLLSRMTDLRCSTAIHQQTDDEISVLVTTPDALSATQLGPRLCPLHPRIVVIDNAHKFAWEADLRRLLAWLSSLPSSATRTVALTSPLLQSPGSLWHLDRVLGRLRQALPGRVEAASELVSILRYVARPSTSLVQYPSAAASSPEAIETSVEAVIGRCRDFLSTHRHSLLDIYGEEFRDLIEDIPDPTTLPLHFLDELACVLRLMGVWGADRAALLLMIKIDKLKTREKYERHFLLLSIVYSELAVIRKLCEDAFGDLPEKERLSRFSKPKLLRLRDVLAAYKPEHIGRPAAASSGDKSSVSEAAVHKPGFRRRTPRGMAHAAVVAGGDSSDSAQRSQASQSSYDYQNGLCCLILVNKSFHAKILYHFLRELSRSEVTYSFLMPQYTAAEDDGAEGLERRKQEEALRRFRMRESNLLVSSCNLEVGIDSVRCNLVVTMDPLENFVAFVNAKVKAKGPKARLLLMVEEGPPTERTVDDIAFFAVIEDRLRSMCASFESDESQRQESSRPSFIFFVNRYCAKLPSDTFTRLMPRFVVRSTTDGRFVCGLQLPINSPVKETVVSAPMGSFEQAKEAAAAEACRRLRLARELDEFMQPTGKDSFHAQQPKAVEASNDAATSSEQEPSVAAPPTLSMTKNINCGRRRQYYNKQVARCLTSVATETSTGSYFLYSISMRLTCPIPEEQNTRGRKIFPPELSEQSLGFLVCAPLPHTCPFPIYTRSGEVLVDIEHLDQQLRLDDRQLAQVLAFHKFTFTQVLRLEKYPMSFGRHESENSVMVVPLRRTDNARRDVDWHFLAHIEKESDVKLRAVNDEERANFVFDESQYEDAVVMPWYRNHDQPQYFYVAEICKHLSPKSAFPGQGFETFEKYYTSKYGINIQNVTAQPLLDVDHTSARLNFLTPRYVNRKGVALPTSSEETKRNKRENLDQKQILVPELCAVHPFRASLWRQAVCLPCVFYRLNGLLLSEQLRAQVAVDVRVGSHDLAPDFRWQPLDFGWTLAEVLRNRQAPGSDSATKKASTPVRTIPPVKSGSGDRDESDSTKEANVGEDGDMNALADQIIHRITEEDQKRKKKKTLEIGTWSNEMASNKIGDVPRTGSRGIPVSDEDDEDDEAFDIDMFDPNIALPDNLTLLSHPTPIQSVKTGGRDWGTGIQQKKFRVGSPTFFSNPNINIPGVVDDMDGYSCSDSSDQEYASEPEEEVVQDMSGHVRIEFRGDNMAEAIEDAGEESKRAEIMAKEREEESRMVEALSWAEWEGNEDTGSESAFEKDVAAMREELCAKKDFLVAPLDSTNPVAVAVAVAVTAESQAAGVPEIAAPELAEDEELRQLAASIHDDLSFVCDSASIERVPLLDEAKDTGLVDTESDLQTPFSFDLQPDLTAHPGPSPSLILQALTMSNSNDAINLERLETIGDSFLKYAITAYLYCMHESVHEGRLSHLRSKQVSNVHLCRLGKARNLGESMVASKFEPHDNWLPPCYHVPKELEQALIESGLPATHWNMADLPGVDRMSKDDIFRLIKEKTQESVTVVVDEDMPSFVPYNLLTQHSIPDKSIADCAEALIGAYLIACGPLGALRFMTWLGIQVLPAGADALPAPASPMAAAGLVSPGRLNPHAQLAFHLQGFDAFENVLGYRFRDRSYLLQAFCHASYFPNRLTDCYQRLEFLGDAVLDYLVTRFLYEDPRKHSPGTLTDLRSALVNNTIFATLAVKFQFHKYFKHFSPGLQQVINRFVKIQAENNYRISDDHYLIEEEESEEAEDIEVPKALGDVFESVAGAIYLDSGLSLDAVWAVYHRMMREEIERFSTNVPKSPIRELLELEPETAKFGKPEKLADGRRMRVVVEVFGKGVFKGIGRNYRIAKCTAAKCALRAIRKAAANGSSNAGASAPKNSARTV